MAGRLGLFFLAGVVIVLLLHLPAGIIAAQKGTETARFDTARWVEATQTYLSNALHGDLGTLQALRVAGYTKDQPVSQVLSTFGPNTAILLLLSLLLSLTLGTLAGVATSRFGLRWLRAPSLAGTLLLLSTPDVLVVVLIRGLLLWIFTTFGVQLFAGVSAGNLTAAKLVAPVLVLSALPLALVARVAAVAFDEVHGELYIRTAVSKGLHPVRVLWGHALKNAWIRVAEAGPMIMTSLVTGLVVAEYVLYFPGVGRTLGLLLERMGTSMAAGRLFWSPGSAAAISGIALMLLLGAALIDLIMNLVRMALDPRLERSRASRESAGRLHLADLGHSVRAILGWPRQLWLGLLDLPERAGRWVWAWRPAHLLKLVLRNPPLLIGLAGVLAFGFIALFGDQIIDLADAHRGPKYIVVDDEVFFPPFKPGLDGYPLGSDMAGRSLLARLLLGARYTLLFTLAVTPLRFLIALPWGLVAGLRRGGAAALGRGLGLIFSALPVILIPATLLPLQRVVTADTRPEAGFWLIAVILAIVGVPRLVESIRLHVEQIAVQPYVEGARAVGAGSGRMLSKHIFPHLTPHLWVAAASDMAWTLLLLAQFGVFSIFLGGSVYAQVGEWSNEAIIMPRIPDWSAMLAKPYEAVYRAPWSLWIPAAAFTLAIIAFNLVAEGLRRQAQALSAQGGPPEPELGPDGVERVPARARRRLRLEWATALLLLIALTGTIARFAGAAAEQKVQALAAQTPFERARLEMQQAIETASGSGDSLTKSKAAAELAPKVATYLSEASQAGRTTAEVQQDTLGRGTLFPLVHPDWEAVHIYIPEVQQASFAVVVQKSTGKASHFYTPFRPAAAAMLETEDGPALVLSGTVPGPDNFMLGAWSPSRYGAWQVNPALMKSLKSKIPSEYGAARAGGFNTALISMTMGPLNTITVQNNGDVRVCISTDGPCTMIPWTGPGW